MATATNLDTATDLGTATFLMDVGTHSTNNPDGHNPRYLELRRAALIRRRANLYQDIDVTRRFIHIINLAMGEHPEAE
jgi:hypothetical protein